MGFFAKSFFRGIAAIVPIAVTIYVLWWFLSGAETILEHLFPENPAWLTDKKQPERLYYQPGLGIAAGVVITVVVGILLNNWLIRWLHDLGISILERVPLVKTIYRMLNDMVSFFAHSDDNQFNQVVMVRPMVDGPEMLGFITRSCWDDMPEGFGGEGKVGVYLPMSYQIGGYLLVVDEKDVRPIDMDMQDALRIALAAGISTPKPKKETQPPNDAGDHDRRASPARP